MAIRRRSVNGTTFLLEILWANFLGHRRPAQAAKDLSPTFSGAVLRKSHFSLAESSLAASWWSTAQSVCLSDDWTPPWNSSWYEVPLNPGLSAAQVSSTPPWPWNQQKQFRMLPTSPCCQQLLRLHRQCAARPKSLSGSFFQLLDMTASLHGCVVRDFCCSHL